MNRLVRVPIRALSAVAPALAARLAGRLWFSIPKHRDPGALREGLATGTAFEVDVEGARIDAWRWGAGPVVLLSHGWGGHAGQLLPFVEPLVRAGLQPIAFDAPSHGHSDPGPLGPGRATLFDFAHALRALSKDRAEIAAVVAHSGACAAVAWELARHPAWPVRRMAFIAPFGGPSRYLGLFQRTLGFSDGAMRRFREGAERRYGFRWEEFEVPAIAGRVATPPLLVVHDRGDRETSWQDGADIAARWPTARLETTEGLGHNRILGDPGVVAKVAEFIAAERGGGATPPRR